ncbi:hypothetical protein V496_05838 [Pseudogymnoascus sp. VKM F-4515 (FW-2607)]|nr:hypothetical protein V496_05838 [Pseudogymnoascus sp. VKM F-4515 (FW-2607)]
MFEIGAVRIFNKNPTTDFTTPSEIFHNQTSVRAPPLHPTLPTWRCTPTGRFAALQLNIGISHVEQMGENGINALSIPALAL